MTGLARRAGAASVVLLGALVGLTACGGDDSDAGLASSTALPHDKSSGTSSDPTTSSELSQENPERFIQRWVVAETRMQNTGKTGPYVALSRECATCRRLARTVAQYYAAGGYIHGGAWRIDSIKVEPASSGLLTYTVRAHVAGMTVRESSSKPVQHAPARNATFVLGLLAKGSSFTVAIRTLG